MYAEVAYEHRHAYISTSFMQPREAKTRHTYHLRNGGLYANVSTTIMQALSRWRRCKCNNNYHTNTVTTASVKMQAQLSYNHDNDDLYTDVRKLLYDHRHGVINTHVSTTTIHSPSREPLFKCNHNYRKTTATISSVQM